MADGRRRGLMVLVGIGADAVRDVGCWVVGVAALVMIVIAVVLLVLR
jgi:hypothetical protein